jgi:hypothetical protein
MQWVKTPAWNIHPGWACRPVQNRHLVLQFLRVRRVNSRLRAVPEELLKPGVPERLDHFNTVSPGDTDVNRDPIALSPLVESASNHAFRRDWF